MQRRIATLRLENNNEEENNASSTKVEEECMSMRCDWNISNDDQLLKYHDEEWGRPQYNSIMLFEMLCLAGQQAGLSWKTILNKRENYRNTFHNFDPVKVSNMNEYDVNNLLNDSGILRNKMKINSIINNAKQYLKLENDGIEFGDFIWSFVGKKPIINRWKSFKEAPTKSPESCAMAKELKTRKFKFVGTTICYAYMQSCGLVNDHIVGCFVRDCD